MSNSSLIYIGESGSRESRGRGQGPRLWTHMVQFVKNLPDQARYELRLSPLPHQEAENITWRSDTGDEDDHRGTNPESPAKAGLSPL